MRTSSQSILDLLRKHPGGLSTRQAASLLSVPRSDYRRFRRAMLELLREGRILRIHQRFHHPDSAPPPPAKQGGRFPVKHGRARRRPPIENSPFKLQSVETERAQGMAALYEEFGLNAGFTREEIAESRRLAEMDPLRSRGRLDLTELITITIDPADARDHDDAVSLSILPDGIRRLGVHIADVSSYIQEGELLDRTAFQRACSAYFYLDTLPMLPPLLSGSVCSLGEGEPRASVSVLMDFDSEGALVETTFAESVVRVGHELSYVQAESILASGEGDLHQLLGEMLSLSETLRRRRADNGAMQFELPEIVPVDRGDGIEGFAPTPLLRSHRVVEEFMLAANEAVGGLLRDRGVPHLRRVHEPPTSEDVESLIHDLGLRRIHWSPGSQPTSGQFHSLAVELADRPDRERLLFRMLRAMSKAQYSPRGMGHFGLAMSDYVHFTSPIRRYADLHTHRRVKELIYGEIGGRRGEPRLLRHSPRGVTPRKRAAKDRSDYSHLFGGKHSRGRQGLGDIAAAINAREIAALSAEREGLKLEMVLWARARMGDSFSAVIRDVLPAGLVIRLKEGGLESFLPAGMLGSDYYLFDADKLEMRGERRGERFQLDQELQVQIVGANLFSRRIQFLLEDMPDSYDTVEKRTRESTQ